MTYYRMNDIDRKILTIIQHNYKRGKFIEIEEIAFRSSYEKKKVRLSIEHLISEDWIEIHNGKLYVVRTLF